MPLLVGAVVLFCLALLAAGAVVFIVALVIAYGLPIILGILLSAYIHSHTNDDPFARTLGIGMVALIVVIIEAIMIIKGFNLQGYSL